MRDKKGFNLKKGLLSVLTICLLLPFLANAGGLSGKISDNTDGSGLVNAIVTLIPSDGSKSRSAAANNNGEFTFSNVSDGIYTIKVTYIGFSTWEKTGILIDESDKTISASLSPTSINMNAISVSASRRPEKIVDAPASVSLVEAEDVAERTTLTATEHIKGLPGVDVASTGLNQSNVVVRGFNNIFSGALLVLTDNRIARVPSLRFNAFNFLPTTNEDIERIEIVSGPGSALYGPNSANGVMHIITKSPFTSQGTSVSLGGGERSVQIISGRHAGVIGDKIGYKFTGQYYTGDDWEHHEPSEPDSIVLFKRYYTDLGTVDDTIKTLFKSNRNFDIKKFSTTGRFDFLLGDNTTLIVNGGYNQSSGIELTGLGAGQAIDWSYMFGQVRLNYKDLFVQTFVNASDAGDTYLLETGQLIVDKSRLWVSQIQHRYAPTDALSLTYGIDALYTRPNTENTINGRNEDDDNINEYGVYIQGDYKFTDKFKFVGAFRVDDNDRLEDKVYSPRAGLVFQPNADNNLRFTYNRAFTTPDNNNLFLDLLVSSDPFGIGASFLPSFGFSPAIDIRVQGVPETGFHWSINGNGPQFRSPFAPLAGMTNEDFINYNDPMFTNVMWSVGSGAVQSGFSDQMNALATAGQITQGQADALIAAVDSVTPGTVSGVNNTMMTFNPDTRSFDPATLDDIKDIDRMRPTITQTLEFGYKTVINNKFQFSLDAYRTQKDDFVGPLTVETPNVFLDPATLSVSVGTDFTVNYASMSAQDRALLDTLDLIAFGGNGNGTPVDELTTMFTSGAAQIPFGTVSPIEQNDPSSVLITYRNFGEITFYGADLAAAYHFNHNWNIGGTYSYVSKNFFAKDANQVHDIYLNAPKNKFGLYLNYINPKLKLNSQLRFRWVDAFKMASPYFGNEVSQYSIFDLNFGIDIIENTHLSLTVQNILDNKHTEFVGGAEIGRLAIMRVTQNF